MELSTPYPWVDLDILEQNIRTQTQSLRAYGIAHRPHIKTHRSIEIARMQLAAGAKGITCAKLAEAMVMAQAGIRDILLAYPLVGEDKMRRLGALLDMAEVTVTVDNLLAARQLSNLGVSKQKKVHVLVEICTPIERGGVQEQSVLPFVRELLQLPGLAFKGLFSYSGLSQKLGTPEKVAAYAKEEAQRLLRVKSTLQKYGIPVKTTSAGSSITSLSPENLAGIDESRAGSYVFNDYHYACEGCIPLDRCALRVKATVVSAPAKNKITLDAGSKSLTTDGKGSSFGYLVQCPEAKIYKLNEEHGFVLLPDGAALKVGDTVDIIPNHSCVVTNLHDYLFGFRRGVFERRIRVDARGKSY